MKKFSFNIKKKEAIEFSRISKDTNPIHLNDKAARLSIHRRNISHGILLILKTFSKINNITKYLKKDYLINIKFLKPTFYDDQIKVLYIMRKNNLEIKTYQNEKVICVISINNFLTKLDNPLMRDDRHSKKKKKIIQMLEIKLMILKWY